MHTSLMVYFADCRRIRRYDSAKYLCSKLASFHAVQQQNLLLLASPNPGSTNVREACFSRLLHLVLIAFPLSSRGGNRFF